jgi:HlyD family secretion protein
LNSYFSRKTLIGLATGALLALVLGWVSLADKDRGPPTGFVTSNGRLEVTEVFVATRIPGRLKSVYVDEGIVVRSGQILAEVEVESLLAQRSEALARVQQALEAIATSEAQVLLQRGEFASVQALVKQRESELLASQRRHRRSQELFEQGFISGQGIDYENAQVEVFSAQVTAARAQMLASEAAISVAMSQVQGAIANASAARAALKRIETEISDCILRAPRDGRIQYMVARAGEILAAGGKVLSLIDLSEVYMTFFLPEAFAGRVALGGEARLILDAAPKIVIPATISFVSSVAQFTPKTVETASEREKFMFRVRAQIDKNLLVKFQENVKGGLPGVAWVRIDDRQAWPEELAVRLP